MVLQHTNENVSINHNSARIKIDPEGLLVKAIFLIERFTDVTIITRFRLRPLP